MIIDLDTATKNVKTADYDVCICGAGAAGITLAVYLARAGKKVALLEAGGFEYSDQSYDCYKGKNTGMEYWGLDTCRLRYLGGTTNHWSGRCKPLDEVDFMERDFFELPGWPIQKSDLANYEAEAKSVVDISGDFTAADISNWTSGKFIPDRYAISAPTRFGDKYRAEIEVSGNISLFINANLIDVRLNKELSSVTELVVMDYGKKRFTFTGKNIVIALGAIENVRMLLNCDTQLKGGIGNQSDFVGRCFMEHYNINYGFFSGNPKYWKNMKKGLSLYTDSQFSLEHKIGNGNVSMSISPAPPTGGGRSKELRKYIRNNVCKWDEITELSRKFVDFQCPGDGILGTLMEQSPNKNSRVSLDKETDSFGLRRVNLSWQMNELDKRTIRTIGIELAKEFARQDYGRVQLASYILDENAKIPVGYHCHSIGTTRMSKSPEYGVVDKDCKVFGIDNLYIGGSSVFSTGGGTNPTFTIVELALRLAKHLS
ncbi:GMC family oxidoreductase [Methyloglobulus sp.]|uniref:GMC family oxidoreductase n=1 Tax=Methyloglobulus sp. TaxID=2518622 RepID=UPI0032B78116